MIMTELDRLVLAEASKQVSGDEVVNTAYETDCRQCKCRIKDDSKIETLSRLEGTCAI